MERLTQKVEALGDIWLLENGKTKEMVTESNEYKEYFEKLAEYEELDEQGFIIRLPCNVGDKLFTIWHEYNIGQVVAVEVKVICFEIYSCRKNIRINAEPVLKRGCIYKFYDDDFGKVLFRTKEEAERKLEEILEGKEWN